ncbi:hypothetical protein V502_03376 [Pseudogymnoascus sp. VKM F-4520 (FW-2644)]|nr:hypothetical protein V502_03376 [Pseudogymnoascus sp. VKM F-4520 (FW-2644)]
MASSACTCAVPSNGCKSIVGMSIDGRARRKEASPGCRSQNQLQRSCGRQEPIANGLQKPEPATKVLWQTGAHCQRFFKQGPKSQYFEVQPVETGPRPTPQMASQTDQFKAAKQEMQRTFEKAKEEENRQIKETDEAKELTKDNEPKFRPLYVLTEAQQLAMQTVRDKIGAFQEWKEEQEKSAEGEDCDEDKGFDDGEDEEGVGVY